MYSCNTNRKQLAEKKQNHSWCMWKSRSINYNIIDNLHFGLLVLFFFLNMCTVIHHIECITALTHTHLLPGMLLVNVRLLPQGNAQLRIKKINCLITTYSYCHSSPVALCQLLTMLPFKLALIHVSKTVYTCIYRVVCQCLHVVMMCVAWYSGSPTTPCWTVVCTGTCFSLAMMCVTW